MRKVLTAVTLLLSATLLWAVPKEPPSDQDAACVLLGQALSDYQRVRGAKTRAEVVKYFTPDGGAQFPSKARYVHPRCGYVHLDVEFELLKPDQIKLLPDDRVISISKLYLEYPAKD